MLTLLDHIALFETKCTPVAFREGPHGAFSSPADVLTPRTEVMPLVYAALESDLQPILEKALEIVPKLAATLDYTTVKTILFPRVAAVFSKTTFLAVKVL
jgi:SCY1-like protein 2